jgi:predicted ABC-type ATPase
VGLFFVILSNVGLNVKRVHERVSRGGHGIPDDVIRRRYGRAIANLPIAIRIAHETVVFDNSGATPVKLVSLVDGNIIQNSLDKATISNCEIAEAIGNALNLPLDSIFKIAKRS